MARSRKGRARRPARPARRRAHGIDGPEGPPGAVRLPLAVVRPPPIRPGCSGPRSRRPRARASTKNRRVRHAPRVAAHGVGHRDEGVVPRPGVRPGRPGQRRRAPLGFRQPAQVEQGLCDEVAGSGTAGDRCRAQPGRGRRAFAAVRRSTPVGAVAQGWQGLGATGAELDSRASAMVATDPAPATCARASLVRRRHARRVVPDRLPQHGPVIHRSSAVNFPGGALVVPGRVAGPLVAR